MGRTVCFCKAIREEKIIEAIVAGAENLEEIQMATTAGTICGRCIPVIDSILEDHESKKENESCKE